MKTVDTNVLVRILIEDPEQTEQTTMARDFAKLAKQLFIAQIVQVELVWVLEVAYEFNKQEIVNILKHLVENEAFELQNETEFMVALNLYQTTLADFSDCLIWAESEKQGYEIVTFDKKFSRLEKVKLLSAHDKNSIK